MTTKNSGGIYGISQTEVNEFLKAPGAIGGTTPAAGAFTTVTASTSATTPTIYGSAASGGDLTIEGSSNATNGDVFIQPTDGNVGIKQSSFGTSAVGVLGIGSGTAPSTSPADAAQIWVQDEGAVAAKAALYMRDEAGNSGPVAFATQVVINQAATDTLTINEVMGTTITNYGQAAENTQTLCAAAAGYKATVRILTSGAGAFHLKAGASDKIYLNGTALDDGDKVSLAAPAIGDQLSIESIQTGASAYDWLVLTENGLWIDGGA